MKFEHTETYGWDAAFRGMRNPKNSHNLSDSFFGLVDEYSEYDFEVAALWADNHFKDTISEEEEDYDYEDKYEKYLIAYDEWLLNNGVLRESSNICAWDTVFIGPNDMTLAQKLEKGGSEHRKFLRQIFVSVDITAPLYWWKEFDTYKVGTTANSTSTMHKLTSKPITLDCFEIDDYIKIGWPNEHNNFIERELIPYLEFLRNKYIETKDKKYWKELIRWLPESWLQTRTVTMNYENLFNMVHQRTGHKLNEWSGKDDNALPNFIKWAKSLPYAKQLIWNEPIEIKINNEPIEIEIL